MHAYIHTYIHTYTHIHMIMVSAGTRTFGLEEMAAAGAAYAAAAAVASWVSVGAGISTEASIG